MWKSHPSLINFRSPKTWLLEWLLSLFLVPLLMCLGSPVALPACNYHFLLPPWKWETGSPEDIFHFHLSVIYSPQLFCTIIIQFLKYIVMLLGKWNTSTKLFQKICNLQCRCEPPSQQKQEVQTDKQTLGINKKTIQLLPSFLKALSKDFILSPF